MERKKNKNNDDYPYTVMKEMFNAIIKTSWLEQVLHLTSQINCHIASTMIYVTKQDRLHSYQDIYWQVVSMSTRVYYFASFCWLKVNYNAEYDKWMAAGPTSRYKHARCPPPVLLYVDRDCCTMTSRQLFHDWTDMHIRLDIWHFMYRFASCCIMESHKLYTWVSGWVVS